MDSTAVIDLASADASYEIRYELLADPGRALVFPCDGRGRVLEGSLSARARSNLARASGLVGRDYAYPVVMRAAAAGAAPGRW